MNKRIFHTCIATLSALLLPCIAMGDAAHPTPSKERKFVYIASFTAPEQILNHGIDPRGTDLNLLSHYTGTYAGRSRTPFIAPPINSGFIDVYEDERSAARALASTFEMANARMTYAEDHRFIGHIYRIQVNENFYSGSISLLDLLHRMRATNGYLLAAFNIEHLEYSAALANQYVTDRSITSDMIESYTQFTIDYRNFGLSSIALNQARVYSDHYVQSNPNSQATARPYLIPLPAPDQPVFPPRPVSPPESSESSWTLSASDDSAGSDHEGDMVAVAGASGILSIAMLAQACTPPSGPMKRSVDSAHCSSLPVTNLSRRSRMLRILFAGGAFLSGSSGGASGSNEG